LLSGGLAWAGAGPVRAEAAAGERAAAQPAAPARAQAPTGVGAARTTTPLLLALPVGPSAEISLLFTPSGGWRSDPPLVARRTCGRWGTSTRRPPTRALRCRQAAQHKSWMSGEEEGGEGGGGGCEPGLRGSARRSGESTRGSSMPAWLTTAASHAGRSGSTCCASPPRLRLWGCSHGRGENDENSVQTYLVPIQYLSLSALTGDCGDAAFDSCLDDASDPGTDDS
jgi:hypothetical protein